MNKIRDNIISTIKEAFITDLRVYALWLEGSDGLGTSDEYSDLDFWFDVQDGEENNILDLCQSILSGIGELDFVQYYDHPHPKIFQRNLHIKGTSEFLLIDICVQSHSRGKEGCTFVEGDIAEFPLILFDKDNVISIIKPPALNKDEIKAAYNKCIDIYSQQSRMKKYILRNNYLEAYIYFDKYVRQPLINLYRIIYTPRHYEYGLVHISSHFPEKVVEELEALYKVRSIEDIKRTVGIANGLYDTAIDKIRSLPWF